MITEEDQTSDKTELFIHLDDNQNLTEFDNDKIDAKFQLEHQTQIEEAQ